MGGLYFSCGDFLGDDKSGSALDQVLKDLKAGLGGVAGGWFEDLLGDADEDQGIAYQIVPKEHDVVISRLTALAATYQAKFPGIEDWYQIFELEIKNGMNPTDGKYGDSVGWKLYCVQDLIKCLEVSKETGEPIMVTGD